MGMQDTKPAKGMSGEKLPKGATASDSTGERKTKLVGGVGMGKADGLGNNSQFKGGSSEKVCYEHKRTAHEQDCK